MIAGTVLELHRWPVKSLAGQPQERLELDGRGVAGDRAHALFDLFKGAPRRVTARELPRMLRWTAAYDGPVTPDRVPLPTLTAPDGRGFSWADPALPDALEADLGRPLALRRDLRLMQDLNDSVLITTQATLDAVSAALGRPLDLRRFRTNVHVALDAPAYAEEGWQGRRLRVGEAELELLHPCERCVIPTRDPDTTEKHADILRWLTRARRGLFGINARPLAPAAIAAGDTVAIV